jgi:ligand-binding sensor domain-containing protein/signal transduction histidine kinase
MRGFVPAFRAGVCALALMLGCGHALGLDPRTPLDGYARQVWNTESGLPQDSVHAILQTADGFLWLGTEGGLARFDGYQFRVFDRESTPALAGNDIRCLLEDRSGALWVGTASGLTRLKDGRARTFGVGDGVPAGAVRSMVESGDGRVWILTADGFAAAPVEHVDAGKISFRTFSQRDGMLSDNVLSLAPDGGDGMWIGTSRGLDHVMGSRVEHGPPVTVGKNIDAIAGVAGHAGAVVVASVDGVFQVENGIATPLTRREALPIGGVQTLLSTREGVWLVGRSSVSFQGPAGIRTFAAAAILPGTQVLTIAEDRHGAVWVGTNGGLARFWNGQMQSVGGKGDSAAVLSIFEDHDGDLWVGTETTGVSVLRSRAFEILQGSEAQTATSVIQAADKSLWVGTNGEGLIHLPGKGGPPQTYTAKDGLASDTVLAIGRRASGYVWAGTPDGLSLLRDGHWHTLTSADGLADDLVRSVLVARDGVVWVGSRHGVTRWKDGVATKLTVVQGLGSDLVGPMLEDAAGDVWIGTSHGLSRLHAGSVKNYTVADGLPSDTITALEANQSGGLWVGTNGQGLARWDGTKFFSYANAAAIPREIYALLEDGSGSLWMFSDRGIFRASIAGLDRFRANQKADIAVVPYGTADGLPPVETATTGYPAAWRLDDGRLAFATRRGVVLFEPSRLSLSDTPPPVALENVTVDDKNVSAEEMASLPPGSLHFSFSFAGIHLAAPQRVQYRYMLEGLDHAWVDVGGRRVAYYTSIPHGHYRFLVSARNAGGTWGPPTELPFVLRPHFYQTIWFRVLLALLVGGMIVAIYRLRVRTLRGRFDAVAAERNRLAREIHDTLAQSFVAVSVRLEVMAQMLRTPDGMELCREQLNQTRTLVREGLEEARRSIWDLRSEGPEAQTLPARFARLVRETTARGTDTRLENTGVYRVLRKSTEDELYRIAQEAVTNAIRHARASTIGLRLSYSLDRVSLEVVDDGVGFDVAAVPATEGGHFGLAGIRERARILNAEVMLESVPGEGTSVRVSVSLARDEKEKRKKA